MSVKKFYDTTGWKKQSKNFIDAEIFEDLRNCAKDYVKNCRLRILRHIPKKGENILDFASGPIQYEEYLRYSENYKYRYCIDFSSDAIEQAKEKLKNHGKYLCDDFMNIDFDKNFFDCSLCIHTLYHIEKNIQKNTVEKLINITKSKKPVIILYSNSDNLISKFKRKLRLNSPNYKNPNIYFYCHELNWWNQFKKFGDVKIYPWRSFASQHQKILFPNNLIGKILFKLLFFLEDYFPNFFVKNFQYYFVVINKN